MSDDESDWEADSNDSLASEELQVDGEEEEAAAAAAAAAQTAGKRPAKAQSTESQTSSTQDKSAIQPISRRPKKPRRKVITDEEVEAESNIPSYQRLTVNGGYAATAAHRRKIGQANAGNIPWNKGRHRSQADKDKIKAAVQARNRRQLLVNLSTIGMSEEECTALRKRIKVVREVLRKTKLNVKKKQEAEQILRKQQAVRDKKEAEQEKEDQHDEESSSVDHDIETSHAPETQPTTNSTAPIEMDIPVPTCPTTNAAAITMASTTEEEMATPDELPDHLPEQREETHTETAAALPFEYEEMAMPPLPVPNVAPLPEITPLLTQSPAVAQEPPSANHVVTTQPVATSNTPTQSTNVTIDKPDYDIEHVPEIFRRDFEWTPHPVYGAGDEPVGSKCPTGGPGGLLCCSHCSNAYSDYLSTTFDELESQKTNKVAAELESISNFLDLNRSRLYVSVDAAQRKPPPSFLGNT